ERPGRTVEHQAAVDLAADFAERRAALALLRQEPARDPLEARPPEGANASAPSARSCRSASTGSALGKARTKASSAAWMKLPRSAAPGSASIGSSAASPRILPA